MVSSQICGAPGDQNCKHASCGGALCRDGAGTRHCGGIGCAGALPISARALSSAHNASQQLEVALGQLGVVAQKVGVVGCSMALSGILLYPLCMSCFCPFQAPKHVSSVCVSYTHSEMPLVPLVCVPSWATAVPSVPLHPPCMLLCRLTSCPLVPSAHPNAPSRGCPMPRAQPGAPQMQEVQELARGARSRAEEALGRSQAARSRAEKATAQLRDFIRRIKAFLAGSDNPRWAHGAWQDSASPP